MTPMQLGPKKRIPYWRAMRRISGFQFFSPLPHFLEPSGNDNRPLHASFPEIFQDFGDGRGRDRQNRQVDGFGKFPATPIGFQTENRFFFGVNRVDLSRVVSPHEVHELNRSHLGKIIGRADDGHGTGVHDGVKGVVFQHDSSPQQPNSRCLDHNTGEIKYSNIDGPVKSPSAALRGNFVVAAHL